MFIPWWTIIQRSSPWFLPFLIAAAVGSVAVGVWMRRRDGSSWWRIGVFGLAVGLCLAYTLTPEGGTLRPWSFPMTAHLTLVDSLSANELFRVTQSSLHVWLFVPLGFTACLQQPRGRRVAAVGLALGAPILIEILQWLLPTLGRATQMGDVVLNLEGVGIGLAVGIIVMAAASRLPGRKARVVDLREKSAAKARA